MSDLSKSEVVHNEQAKPDIPPDDVSESSEKRGTRADILSMWRLGKKQEFLRNFRFISIYGFSMILMATWEIMLGCVLPSCYRPATHNQPSTSGIALIDGGKAGMIWMNVVAWVGFLCVNISMAEMGSMAPTSGTKPEVQSAWIFSDVTRLTLSVKSSDYPYCTIPYFQLC
jgi:choline transport protein